MTTIIHISGQGNSGKTTAIKLFSANAQRAGATVVDQMAGLRIEICQILRYSIGGQTFDVGVASAGDDMKHLNANHAFFAQHQAVNGPLDVIVCASKSRGVTFASTQRLGTAPNQYVNIAKIAATHADNARVATAIAANIP